MPTRCRDGPTTDRPIAGRLWVILAASSFSPFWSAPQKELKQMPGQVPKRPPYVGGFPIPFHRMVDYRPLQGSVVAADLEKTGHPDLVVSLTNRPDHRRARRRLDASRLAGLSSQLPQPAYPYGDAAVGDLDGDGSSEIVTCVVSGNVPRRIPVTAFRADGSDLPGWPVEMKAPGQGTTPARPPACCSPISTVTAARMSCAGYEPRRGAGVRRIGAAAARLARRLPPDAAGRVRGINADLAAADLDGDGRQEVIFVESGLEPRLVAVAPDGRPMPGFPRVLS